MYIYTRICVDTHMNIYVSHKHTYTYIRTRIYVYAYTIYEVLHIHISVYLSNTWTTTGEENNSTTNRNRTRLQGLGIQCNQLYQTSRKEDFFPLVFASPILYSLPVKQVVPSIRIYVSYVYVSYGYFSICTILYIHKYVYILSVHRDMYVEIICVDMCT